MKRERQDEVFRIASQRFEEQYGRPMDLKNMPADYEIALELIVDRLTEEEQDEDSEIAMLNEVERGMGAPWDSPEDDDGDGDQWMDGGDG